MTNKTFLKKVQRNSHLLPYILSPRNNFSRLINEIKILRHANSPILKYRPRKLSIYITSRCNLSCNMCGYQSTHSSGEFRTTSRYPDMDLEKFKHILSFFPEAYSLTLTGEGEPFLNKDIFRMIDYAKNDRHYHIDTSTNGCNLTNRQIQDLVDSKLDALQISLDGTCPAEYKHVRGGTEQQFKNLVSNIKLIHSLKNSQKILLQINLSFIITMTNYQNIPRMIDFAIELGADGIHFQNVVDFHTEFAKNNRPLLTTDTDAINFIDSIRKPPALKRLILPLPYHPNYGNVKHFVPCPHPFASIGINTNGNINPCFQINTNECFGNIFTELDTWNNGSFQHIRENLLHGRMPFQLCATCPAFGEGI